MSREPFHMKACLGMLMTLMLFAITTQRSVAQLTCLCMTPDVVQRVQICAEGQIRTVDVTLCTDGFCPATGYPEPCANQTINGRTTIRKICPIGWSTTSIDNILISTIKALGICCSGNTYLPACALNTDYVWLVSSAKCWQLDPLTNCWAACPGSGCCSFLIRFQPGVPTPGECLTTIIHGCTDPGTCPPGACQAQICTLPGGGSCCL